jgi:hypothetical protein
MGALVWFGFLIALLSMAAVGVVFIANELMRTKRPEASGLAVRGRAFADALRERVEGNAHPPTTVSSTRLMQVRDQRFSTLGERECPRRRRRGNAGRRRF